MTENAQGGWRNFQPTKGTLLWSFLAGIVATLVVGFAAETGSAAQVLELGRAKARRKGADLLAVNAVGGGHGFGDVPNAVTVLDRDGEPVGEAAGTKDEVAAGLWDLIVSRLT